MSNEGAADFVFTRVRIRFESEFETVSEITDLHPAFPKNGRNISILQELR